MFDKTRLTYFLPYMISDWLTGIFSGWDDEARAAAGRGRPGLADPEPRPDQPRERLPHPVHGQRGRGEQGQQGGQRGARDHRHQRHSHKAGWVFG